MKWIWVAVPVLLAGCGGSSTSPAPAVVASSPNYTQSTCRDFTDEFTDAQRHDAASIALIRLRHDDGRPAPSDRDIDSFAAGMDGACRATPSTSIVQAAVAVYFN